MQQLDLLVAEPHELHERHVLVRHRDEEGLDHRLVGTAPVAPGQLLVLATPGAHTVPSLVEALPGLLSDFMTGIETVWVGVGGLAASAEAAVALAEELGVDVVAPDGGVAAMPGAALYAGQGAGGNGWFRFSPDGSASFHGARLPLPSWESWVPADPLQVSGVPVTPAPCGLLVAGSVEVAFDVPVNQRFPKVVVCAPLPPPSVVAELLGGLPDEPVMIVPEVPGAATHIWQAELAMSLSRDVVFSAGAQVRGRAGAVATIVPDGSGVRRYRPFPLVLRQSARGGDQQVLDIATAPPGWERAGRRSYRLADGDGAVVADVVPSGLVLRAADGEPLDAAAGAAPFDPEGWTLALGTSGQPVGPPVLAAAERLLAALPAGQRAVARVRMAGTMNEAAEHALDRFAADRREFPAREPVTADTAAAPPVLPAGMPPVMTTSGAPVSTVSGAPAPVRPPEPVRRETEKEPESEQPRPDDTARPPAERAPLVEGPPPVTAPAGVAAQAEPVRPAPEGKRLAVPSRDSTSAEQNRFTAAAGEYFTQALATVNAAMATWPSMRMNESAGAKADYVAVCLFLGRGAGDASSVNGAVRIGQAGMLDGQIPCLVSGIRRLPTQRRAVLRLGKVNESLEHQSTPGTVLTEPGFLAASIDLDVTVPGADLDVLIWPSSARRTSELMLGRPVDEAVFLAGARFKALAVRTAAENEETGESAEDGSPTVPKVAVLYRELAPGETPTTELDERDLAVLVKLDSVLARRHRGALRLVDDPGVVARLTTSMVAWQREAAAAVAS